MKRQTLTERVKEVVAGASAAWRDERRKIEEDWRTEKQKVDTDDRAAINRLEAAKDARVTDLGCQLGWRTSGSQGRTL